MTNPPGGEDVIVVVVRSARGADNPQRNYGDSVGQRSIVTIEEERTSMVIAEHFRQRMTEPRGRWPTLSVF